jgi:hypothetical protein
MTYDEQVDSGLSLSKHSAAIQEEERQDEIASRYEEEAPPQMDKEMFAMLVWMEAKQVTRGCGSEIFPDMTYTEACQIRTMGIDRFSRLITDEDIAGVAHAEP